MFKITVTKCGNFVQTLEVAAFNAVEAIAKAKQLMGLKPLRVSWGEGPGDNAMVVTGWSGHMFEARQM